MVTGFSKSSLAIQLSRLKVFTSPKPKLEQYPTDSEIAAEVLWNAHMNQDIEHKSMADLGCGTGILGIGALLLGAKHVHFVEKDDVAIDVLKENLAGLKINKGFTIVESDISSFDEKVDLVLQNPPFGTRDEHADRVFLEKAFSIADTVYSFHKTSTTKFIEKFSHDSGFDVSARWDFEFPLKQTLEQHKRKIHRIAVSCFRLEKADIKP